MQNSDIRYYKDFKHNYLVIAYNDNLTKNLYRVKMITENQISGLLPCQERHINGETLLYYDITSKQNISRLYDSSSFNLQELHGLFIQLKLVNDLLQKYLLHENGLFLQPEYIFKDLNTGKYTFLYYPGADNDSMSDLANFLISKVDNNDETAVEIIYRIADSIQKDQAKMDEIINWFSTEDIKSPNTENETSLYNKESYASSSIGSELQKENEMSLKNKNKEKSLLKNFFCKIFHIKQSNMDTQYIAPTYRDTMEAEYVNNNKNADNTVFIPWTECCENKLFGISRGNKYHIDLDKLPITVGKMVGAVNMVINDQSISRMHVKFAKENGHIMMTDLNSTNGTFRNGLRLEPNETQIIELGDEIKLGKLKFIYR